MVYYPHGFVCRRSQSKPSCHVSSEHRHKPFVVIPYVRGLSEAIKCLLSCVDIRVLHRPHTTLHHELVHHKDPSPIAEKSGVVYSIPCSTCNEVYIGQTGRHLETRLKEHKVAVKFAKTEISAVAEHVWLKKHQIDFQSTAILAKEQDSKKRCFTESWHIQTQRCMNREIGPLPPVYKCLYTSLVILLFYIFFMP